MWSPWSWFQPTPFFFKLFYFFNYFIFFPIIFISWRLITLQYCSGFCHTLTWNRSPAQVGCMRQVLGSGALGRPRGIGMGITCKSTPFFFFNVLSCLLGKNFTNITYISGKIWNASWICVSSLRRGHANLLCIVPILVYVLPKRAQSTPSLWWWYLLSFPGGSAVKNPMQEKTDSIPRLGRCPEEGKGCPLQYSCLGNLPDRGGWQATVHRITKSHTWLSASD